MSGTVIQRKGFALLALGVALALASVGCIGAPGDDSDEDVGDAVQQLDSVGSPGSQQDGEAAAGDQDDEDANLGGDIEAEGDIEPGEDSEDPQPVPWRPPSDPDDSEADPDPSHMTQGSSSTPSGGTGGK